MESVASTWIVQVVSCCLSLSASPDQNSIKDDRGEQDQQLPLRAEDVSTEPVLVVVAAALFLKHSFTAENQVIHININENF